MKIISTISQVLLASLFVFSFQSCDKQGGLSASDAVKKIMISSVDHSFSVLGNNKDFLSNALVSAVMPEELKKINSTLESLGLGSVVEKEKEYIGKAAASSVNIAKPIITSAIQDISLTDAAKIVSGGKGAAIQYLQDKTETKLIEAIKPEVANQLEANGLNPLLNQANQGKQVVDMVGGLLGNQSQSTDSNLSQSISKYAAQQIVAGMFAVAKDYESKNSNIVGGIINSVLGGNN